MTPKTYINSHATFSFSTCLGKISE